jgi:hypothetical protein
MYLQEYKNLHHNIRTSDSQDDALESLMRMLLKAENVFKIDPRLSEMDEIMDWIAWVRDMAIEFNYNFKILDPKEV